MDSRISRPLESDATIAPRSMGREWALVQQAIAGDTDALELLAAPYLGRLYRLVLTVLRNQEDAEDALQNGLFNAYSNLRSFRGRSSFSTWLNHVVMNSALNFLRRKKPHPESSLDEILDNQPEWQAHVAAEKKPNPEQVCALVELNALIEEQIRKLPISEQAVFRDYAINGFSMKESCQALGIPEGTFKSRIFRTRRKLAHGLQCSLDRTYGISSKGKSFHAAQC